MRFPCPDDPNGLLLGLFFLALALTGFLMKLVAMLVPASKRGETSRVFWLLLCPASHRRLRPTGKLRVAVLRVVLFCGAVYVSHRGVSWCRAFSGMPKLALSYGAVPVLWFASEALLALVTLLWWPAGRRLPALHDRPWRVGSVGEFWGRRWNLWFSDWFRSVIFFPLRRRPILALVLCFFVSGALHEWVVNVPLYCVTGHAMFGGMLLYFLLQAVGVLLEPRWRHRPGLKRAWAWLVVLGPAPLVLNEGLLRILHLWP